MALNDILKNMPSMGFDFPEYAPPEELNFDTSRLNNRVLAVPPYSDVSLHKFKMIPQPKLPFIYSTL